jgi:uncharacterized Zn finger protein
VSGRTVVHPRFGPRSQKARAGTWWGRAWVRAVEEASYSSSDLLLGRRLSRAGHVGQIMVEPGRFVASVEDGRGLWTVAGTLPVLDDSARDALVETVAAEAGRIGALLQGDLPHLLVEHAEEAGVELLPYGTELGGDCSCDAWTQPCPHALAVLYQLTWLVEADPFVLFHLRGLPREDLLARLHEHTPRSSSGSEDPGDEDLEIAYDAALRAARALSLLGEDPAARVEHLL